MLIERSDQSRTEKPEAEEDRSRVLVPDAMFHARERKPKQMVVQNIGQRQA